MGGRAQRRVVASEPTRVLVGLAAPWGRVGRASGTRGSSSALAGSEWPDANADLKASHSFVETHLQAPSKQCLQCNADDSNRSDTQQENMATKSIAAACAVESHLLNTTCHGCAQLGLCCRTTQVQGAS